MNSFWNFQHQRVNLFFKILKKPLGVESTPPLTLYPGGFISLFPYLLMLMFTLLLAIQFSTLFVNSYISACEIRPYGTRIRGGKEAVPHSWSWQASLRFNGDHICGASLITSECLVTASHCVSQNPDPKQYKIVLGKRFRTL